MYLHHPAHQCRNSLSGSGTPALRSGSTCTAFPCVSRTCLTSSQAPAPASAFKHAFPAFVHCSAAATPSRHVTSATAIASEPVTFSENIQDKELHLEASESYLSYAMSVIVGRALPDVRDGLKPVHRRILFAMHDLGLAHGKPFKKCARVVGEVLGKYHPHGDTAVYDAMVRLAQDFSMRDPLVSGHGNFGSLDDDPAAAMRYTECRLQSVAEDALLADLGRATVDWVPTFDASQDEPLVLPARIPHLLVNGASGIAVGIATRIPPHNMREVVAGLRALIKNPDITVKELMEFVPAPDFPTGGEAVLGPESFDMYQTGRGSVLLRAKVAIEDDNLPIPSSAALGKKKKPASGKAAVAAAAVAVPASSSSSSRSGTEKLKLVISEVPYQTSKADLVQKIAELVEDKTIEGVSDVRDESDREGMRVVIEVKKGHPPESVLQQLFKHTRLQQRFPANMVALVEGSPKTLSLKEFLAYFLSFRVDIVERRAAQQLSVAMARLHILEGFIAALASMDAIVTLIRGADDSASARMGLVTHHGLSEEQAEAVLGLTLRRLTGLEAGKLAVEATSLKALVLDLQDLLADKARVLQLVLTEAEAVAAKHGTPRRTRLFGSSFPAAITTSPVVGGDVTDGEGSEHWSSGSSEVEREVLLVYNQRGYVKRQDLADFSVVKKGKSSAKIKEPADLLQTVLKTTMDQPLMVLTTKGRGFGMQAKQIPEVPTNSAGTAVAQVLKSASGISGVIAILPLQMGDPIANEGTSRSAVTPPQPSTFGSLLMVTQRAGIKRTETPSQIYRKAGTQMINLAAEDSLAWAGTANEDDVILMASSVGRLSAFPVREVRKASPLSAAVKGMTLTNPLHMLVSTCIIPPQLATDCLTSSDPLESMEDTSDDDVHGSNGRSEPHGSSNNNSSSSSSSSSSSTDVRAAFVPCIVMLTLHGFGKKIALASIPMGKRAQSGGMFFPMKDGDQVNHIQLVKEAGEDIFIVSKLGEHVRISVDDMPLKKRYQSGTRLLDMAAHDTVLGVAGNVKREQL